MALASAVVVFASIAAFAEIYASANHQVAVLIVTETIQQGQRINGSELGQANVTTSGGLAPIAVSDVAQLSGKRAAVTIPAGSLLTAGDVTDSQPISLGDAVVGMALKAGQFPSSGVDPGDQVMIVQTADPGSPLASPATGGNASGDSGASTGVLVPQATVFDVETSPVDSQSGQSQQVSVEVSSTVAAAVSTAAAVDQVSLVLLPASAAGQGNAPLHQGQGRDHQSGTGS
jgi:SAF domain